MTQDLRTCIAWTVLLSCRNHLLGHANCLALAAEAGVCMQVASKDYFNIEERWVVRLNEAWCCDPKPEAPACTIFSPAGDEETARHEGCRHREAL